MSAVVSPRYQFERLRGSYLYGPGSRIDPGYRSGRWAEPVDRLLGAGYGFAAVGFGGDGVLFRGVSRGLRAGLAAGRFGPAGGDTEYALVEQVMNVCFLSHEPGDALAEAGLHREPADAGVLVVPARVFAAAAGRGEAAVLSIGDAGVVFRYPLLARPLAVAEVAAVLVPASGLAARPPDVAAPRVHALAGADRAAIEASLQACLADLGMTPAQPRPAAEWPRRG